MTGQRVDTSQDHYAVLQVAPDAEAPVLKAAFRTLADRYHPDHGGTQEQMQRLALAWQVLGASETRRAYDATREAAAAVEPEEPYEPMGGAEGWGEAIVDPPPPPAWQPPPQQQWPVRHQWPQQQWPVQRQWYSQWAPSWQAPAPASTWYGLNVAPRNRKALWALIVACAAMSPYTAVLGPVAVWLGVRALRETGWRQRDSTLLGLSAILLGGACTAAILVWLVMLLPFV